MDRWEHLTKAGEWREMRPEKALLGSAPAEDSAEESPTKGKSQMGLQASGVWGKLRIFKYLPS